jgi:peptide chain release factor 2
MLDKALLKKEIEDLLIAFKQLSADLDVESVKSKLDSLRQKMEASDFWQDQDEAANISRQAELLNKDWHKWQTLESNLLDNQKLLEMASLEEDKALLTDISQNIEKLKLELKSLEVLALYNGRYDNYNAILSINTGAGGVDAQDWTEMMERMYLRFAERQGWQAEILDRIVANEAGLKNVMIKFSGLRVYGNLKSENGTHRLLRNSPFNADGLRQTSFASVEVIPDIPAREIEIKEEDVRIDVFRSSGPGGQSVNTTDSAIRLVHLPTKITISCQSERSQHQNKENAFSVLRAKLVKLELEKKEAEEKKLKGEVRADWGQQIRSYWFYGNKLVKDHRSNFSDSDVEAVMAGKLEDFIAAYLRWLRDEL